MAGVREKPRPDRDFSHLWIYAALFLTTLAVYARVGRFDFVNFDDPDYVTNNVHVRNGLTPDSIQWAFTSTEAANWFPLTRLSHLLDGQLFGLRSGWHHLDSALIHALSTLLLFAFLDGATRARWPSAIVSFLFALHPLHVESVAWVAERKDVLSAFFWFLALWAYVRGRHLVVFAAFALGLMAKPMIVTLPFVLLLLDVWPLQRPRTAALLREKIPLFALAAAGAIATYLVQRGSGAVRELSAFPLGLRIENALVSYVVYIGKTFWPSGLAVFYPYPAGIPVGEAVLAGIALTGISVIVVRSLGKRPYLAVGWFWYLGTLVPVIGLVQVGAQARADRYMYVPMVGLLIMLAWGAAEIPWKPRMAALIAACASLAVITWIQIGYWQNSERLFRHALDVTSANYLAHHNLGVALEDDPGRLNEATSHLRAAIAIQPGNARAHTDLGNALSKLPGSLPEAVEEYQAAVRLEPESAIPHNDLGNTLLQLGRMSEAIREYDTALRIDPNYGEARHNLELARTSRPVAHYNHGVELSNGGKVPEAIAEFEEALRLQPDYADAHNNLGVVLSAVPGRLPDAIGHFQAAIRLRPDYFDAHYNLGAALSGIPGRTSEALAQFEAALRIRPDPEVRQVVERLRAGQR